jgi:transcriptional regulator with XRE-family HTH domain
MDLHAVLGRRIRDLRADAGLSQAALAMSAGLDRAFVGAVERGDKSIGLTALSKLSRALGVEPWELLRPAQANPSKEDEPRQRLLRHLAVAAEGASEAEAAAFGAIVDAFFGLLRRDRSQGRRGRSRR